MTSKSQEVFLTANLKKLLTKTLIFCIICTMKNYEKKPWSRGERIVLEKWAGLRTVREISEMLPDRTETSVRKQIEYLRKHGWRV